MILTDDEIDALWADEPSVPQRVKRRELVRIAQTAILRKLATMSVKPRAWEVQRAMAEPHLSYSKTKGALSNEPLYQAKALAAARVQGMDEYVPCYSKPLNKLLEPK